MNADSRRQSRTRSDAYWRGALLVAIVSLAYLTCAPRAGEVYKSVDAQGNVVYSDQADMSTAQPPPVETGDSNPVADVEVRAADAPPALQDEEQPPCPEEGYLWTPGYWAWSAAGYYWVPGAWVLPPRVGTSWTPGYWGYVDAIYIFHRGYWAPHIGYYGGINYGFGYFGVGFAGGRWVGNSFAYNRTVSNLGAHVFHHVYSETVYGNAVRGRTSYNGGPGGTNLAPTAQERAVAAEPHIPPTPLQRQNMAQAARMPTLMQQTPVRVIQPATSTDHPSMAAMPKPVKFNAPAVRARSRAALASTSRRPVHAAAHPTMPAPKRTTPIKTQSPTH